MAVARRDSRSNDVFRRIFEPIDFGVGEDFKHHLSELGQADFFPAAVSREVFMADALRPGVGGGTGR